MAYPPSLVYRVVIVPTLFEAPVALTPIVGITRTLQRFFRQATYPFHDAAHHIAWSLGVPRRLEDEPHRGTVQLTVQKEPQHHYPVADSGMPIVQDSAGLVVECLQTALACVPPQVLLVEAVFGDVLLPAVWTKHLAVPSYHMEHPAAAALDK